MSIIPFKKRVSIRDEFEKHLDNKLNELYTHPKLRKAILHAFSGQSKNFRPLLFLYVCESLKQNVMSNLDVALAIEYVHTYSLIHDDLPALDNDLYRRGKTSVWNEFGQDTAILAGDALLTEAFRLISDANVNCSDAKKLRLISKFSQLIGHEGMIKGQMYDLENVNAKSSDSLIRQIYINKTAKLIIFCIIAPAIMAGTKHIEGFYNLGLNLGLLFQIRDDYLEKYQPNAIDKDVDSDEKNNKKTFVMMHSKQEVEAKMSELEEKVFTQIKTLKLNNHVQILIKNLLA